MSGSLILHELHLLLQFGGIMALDELLIHLLDAVEQTGLLVDLHQRILEFVVVKILLLVVDQQLGQSANVALGDDIGSESAQFLNGCLDRPS